MRRRSRDPRTRSWSASIDPDAGRATALAEENGAKAYAELDALLGAKDVDAVIVATPNLFHGEAVIAAADAGKHVLCEKPLALDIQTARKMVEACAAKTLVLQVGFNQRFWAQVQIAKSLVDSGFIGDVHGFRSVYSEKSTAYPAATRYRYDLKQSGGATIIDLTIHRIDLARYLIGDFSAVVAELAHSVLPDKVDDNVWLLARFKNGARGCSIERPLLAGDRRRHRPFWRRGLDPHRDGDAEPVPCGTARGLHREIGEGPARCLARGALSRRLVEELRGWLDHREAAAQEPL